MRELWPKQCLGRSFGGSVFFSDLADLERLKSAGFTLGTLSFKCHLSNEPLRRPFGPKLTPKRPKRLDRLPADFSRPSASALCALCGTRCCHVLIPCASNFFYTLLNIRLLEKLTAPTTHFYCIKRVEPSY